MEGEKRAFRARCTNRAQPGSTDSLQPGLDQCLSIVILPLKKKKKKGEGEKKSRRIAVTDCPMAAPGLRRVTERERERGTFCHPNPLNHPHSNTRTHCNNFQPLRHDRQEPRGSSSSESSSSSSSTHSAQGAALAPGEYYTQQYKQTNKQTDKAPPSPRDWIPTQIQATADTKKGGELRPGGARKE